MSTDILSMDEITLKITIEQYTMIQKMLEPYVKASVNIANQFKIQQDLMQKKQIKDKE